MSNKILTLDNLYEFFVQQNKTINFNSKESGKPIVVKTVGNFSTEENEMPGMLKLKFKVCHINKNRNGSNISKENMEKAMPTLKYRPVLAYIHELEDGTKDFYAHNCEFIENEDGETEIVYTEKQVGCFTAEEPWLEYDEENDKTYVMAYAVIPEEYTETADIIRRKEGTKVSCELFINTLEYNAKEKYLDLVDFYFGGCTLLGKDEDGNEIGEGMLGSRADIADFCHKEPVFNCQDELIKVLNKLDETLSNFNKSENQKGGEAEMGKFEELLEKYGKTAEDIEFENEGMSDEELEAKFAEMFDDTGDGDSGSSEGSSEGAEEGDTSSEADDEPAAQSEEDAEDDEEEADDEEAAGTDDDSTKKKKYELLFELSHDDIRCGLYNLLRAQSEEDYWYTWILDVYDNYFIYESYGSDVSYARQKYTRDGDNIAFDGEPVAVFSEWLTQEEKDALAALKSDYAELKEFKENYDAAEIKAEKEAIFEMPEYAEIKETEEFKALVEEADKYSVEELKVKADLLFAASMKKKFSFEAEKPEEKHSVGINFNVKPDPKKQAYAGLFADENK